MMATDFDLKGSLTNETLLRKLNHIEEYVKQLLVRIGDHPFHPYFTAHGIPHLKNVMKHVNILTKDLMETERKLNQYEIFVLCSAVWLHDIGMLVKKEEGEDHESVRKVHHIRSEEFIKKNREKLLLTDDNLYIPVGLVSKGHRKVDLNAPEYEDGFFGDNIRIRLLSAILRISDELDVGHTRAPDWVRKALGSKFSKENLFHWIKHKFVQGVKPEYYIDAYGSKTIVMNVETNLSKEDYSEKIIQPFVVSPILEELRKIEGILNKAGIFLEVKEKSRIDRNLEELSTEDMDVFNKFKYNLFIKTNDGRATEELLDKIGFNESERHIVLFTIWNSDPIWEERVDDVYCKIEKNDVLDYTLIGEEDYNNGINSLNEKHTHLVVKRDSDERLNLKALCEYIGREVQSNEGLALERYIEINPKVRTFIQKLYDKTYYLPVKGVTVDPYDPKYRAKAIIERANKESKIKELRVQAYSYKNNIDDEIIPILRNLAEYTKMRFLLINPITSPYIRKDEDIYEIVKNAKLIMDLGKDRKKNISIKFYGGKSFEREGLECEELLFRGHIIDKRIISFATWPFHIKTKRVKFVDGKAEEVKLGDPRHGAKITYLEGPETSSLLLYLNYFDNIWSDEKKPTYQDLEALIKLYFERGVEVDEFVKEIRIERGDLVEKWNLEDGTAKKRFERIIDEIRNDKEGPWYNEIR